MEVRQGGVPSPLLWNMHIDSLLRCLRNQGLWAQGSADDVVSLINGKFLSTICELMQFRDGVSDLVCLLILTRQRLFCSQTVETLMSF
jgi:hypothetical protein